jgi:DeoR/GlpR family transcriptional regulator of sugar metabolism
MLTKHRKHLLLEELQKHGQIVAKEMSEKFNLSEDTIRRDLRELAADGKLVRVHGGALRQSPTVGSLEKRRTMLSDEKRMLGQAGAHLLKQAKTIFVDGGTTNLELIKALPFGINATIVTHSPIIAAALELHEGVRVYMIGGSLFRQSMVATGAAALESIGNMRFDICFIGANGLHAQEGLTTGDYEEAAMKRAIIGRSAQTVTLITSDKINTVAAHRICAIDALTQIVTSNTTGIELSAELMPRLLLV